MNGGGRGCAHVARKVAGLCVGGDGGSASGQSQRWPQRQLAGGKKGQFPDALKPIYHTCSYRTRNSADVSAVVVALAAGSGAKD